MDPILSSCCASGRFLSLSVFLFFAGLPRGLPVVPRLILPLLIRRIGRLVRGQRVVCGRSPFLACWCAIKGKYLACRLGGGPAVHGLPSCLVTPRFETCWYPVVLFALEEGHFGLLRHLLPYSAGRAACPMLASAIGTPWCHHLTPLA